MPEENENQRKNLASDRANTTETRKTVQKQREELYDKRALLGEQENNADSAAEVVRLQGVTGGFQQAILELQENSHGQQDSVLHLREKNSGNQKQGAVEDTQKRAENIQLMQENLQKLREDIQRQREEWKQQQLKHKKKEV